MIKIRVRPPQPVKVGTDTSYLYDPSIVDAEVQQAKDWATKTDGMVEEDGLGVDYSAKAYAVGGAGTASNNAKYYAELADLSATSASSSATSASNSAISASADAGTATTKASEAATSATNASNSATSASNSATIASDKATIATTQAGIATTAANTATTQAGIATSKATEASGYASSANVSAQHASTSETNASIWAEGSDGQVALLGGEKSSKGWAARAKEIVDSIGSVLRYKGSVNTRADLPTTGQVIGDMYNILSDGSNVVWDGSDWDDISGIVDLSEYRKAAAQDTIDAGKVPTSRTVNGKALSSDVTLTYTDVGALPDSTVIPTVNNPTITLTQGGVTKGTFTLNQSSNKTIDFEATGATGANTSLSNLTSTGKNIGNWSTNVSNCITEITQDIKLELNNGTLTLKSGSVITYPDGSQYQTTADKTVSTGLNNGLNFICLYESSFNMAGRPVANSVSGAGATTSSGLAYDTTANKVGFYNISGQLTAYCSFPFCIINVVSGVITSIDQVFNGAGYIGHHAFVLPGVKGLVPNGFNEDGSLKSVQVKTSALKIFECNSGVKCYVIFNSYNGFTKYGYKEVETPEDITPSAWFDYYVKSKNVIYCTNGSSVIISTNEKTVRFLDLVSNGTTITDFTIRQPVRLATTEMLDKKQDTLTFDTTPTSSSTNPVTSGGVYTALSSKANTSLNNLDATGQMVIDSQNGTISNCIRYIPQDINLTLSNGTLTLKSGSILTAPDGTQRTTTEDKTISTATVGTDKCFIYATKATGSLGGFYNNTKVSLCGSGTTLPADDTTYKRFFNTTDSKIYEWSNNAWSELTSCFPLGIVSVENNVITSIDKVFNGAGYIGHHAFVLPGVKALIPDGKNTDGTLRSTNIKTNSLVVLALQTYNTDNRKIFINESGFIGQQMFKPDVDTFEEIVKENWYYQYVKSDNIFYQYVSDVLYNRNVVPFVSFKTQGSTVTQFDVRQPVKLATTEMVDSLNATVSTKANDSDVVKLAGNQTIAGTKTFSSTISGSIDGNAGTVTNGVYTTGNQNIAGNKTFTGTTTFSSNGSVQFNGPVGLGNNALTGTTYPPYNDATQRVANTVWCQMLFANAIGTPRDVTILWGNGTGVGTPIQFDLSEEFTNFEQIGVVMSGDTGLGKGVSIKSTFWLDWLLKNTGSGAYDSVLLGNAAEVYCRIRSYNYSTPSTTTKFIMQQENGLFFYIFGINRKVVSPVNPFSS